MSETKCINCSHFVQEWEESDDTGEMFLRSLCRIKEEPDMPVCWNSTGCMIPKSKLITCV